MIVMSEKEIALMWDQYALTKSSEIKEKIIIHYASLVKYIAGRMNMYLGQNVEYDRGAIIDHIRKLDWVPRSLRKKQKDLQNAYTKLESNLGRPATDEDVMAFLDLSNEEFHELLQEASVSNLISLEQYVEQGQIVGDINDSNDNLNHPETYIEKLDIQNTLKDAINQLPDREKKVITLYYFEELMLKEISHIMGVSESRVSQLHTKGLSRLKGKLGERGGGNID